MITPHGEMSEDYNEWARGKTIMMIVVSLISHPGSSPLLCRGFRDLMDDRSRGGGGGGGGGEEGGELGRREDLGRKEGLERRGNIERGGGAFHMNTASR